MTVQIKSGFEHLADELSSHDSLEPSHVSAVCVNKKRIVPQTRMTVSHTANHFQPLGLLGGFKNLIWKRICRDTNHNETNKTFITKKRTIS